MKLYSKLLVSAVALCMTVAVSAQQAREDFRKDITLSGSNYKAYPGPQKALTPAPAGLQAIPHTISVIMAVMALAISSVLWTMTYHSMP